jgi:hypothetical protein
VKNLRDFNEKLNFLYWKIFDWIAGFLNGKIGNR